MDNFVQEVAMQQPLEVAVTAADLHRHNNASPADSFKSSVKSLDTGFKDGQSYMV